MPFPFYPIAQEQAVIDGIGAERQRIAEARANATPQLSANLSGLHRSYPWMSPGVTYALAKANYTANHPVAQAAAQTELTGQLARNGGYRIGDVVNLPDGKPNLPINTGLGPITPQGLQAVGVEQSKQHPELAKQASQLDDAIQTLKDQRGMDWEGQSIGDRPNIKSLGITKASQIPKMIQTLSKLRDGLTHGNVNALGTAQAITGSLQAGTNAYEHQNIVQAAAGGILSGTGAITKAVTGAIGQATNLYQQAADELPQGPTSVVDATKGVSRGAAVALETPFQAVQGTLREVVAKTGQGDIFNAWQTSDLGHVAAQTSGGQALSALVKGDPIDLGTGYLPNPNSGVEQAQAQAARTYSPYLIDGHAWTPGRATANLVTEPGTPAYNLLSGAVDAAIQFKTDPTIVGMTALGDARAAGKTFAGYGQGEKPGLAAALLQGTGAGTTPDVLAAERVTQALREGGHAAAADIYAENAGLVNATRRTINTQPAQTWAATSTDAAKVWDAVAAEKSPSAIVRGFGRDFPIQTLDGTPLAKNLAAASTTDEVLGQLVPHLDPYFPKIPDYTRVGTTGSYVQPRLAYDVPKNTWDANDIQSAFWTAHDYMVTAKVPIAQQTAVLDKMINLWNVDRYQGLKSMYDVVGQSLVAHGMDEDWVKQFMSMKQGLHAQYSKFATDEIGNNMPVQGGLIGGDGVPLPSPQLQTELLNSKVTLPDIRELRRATANPALHWLVNNDAWKGAMSLADGALTTWRDAHLLRPALTARILLDDQASIAATGGDSIFSHPLRAISWSVGSDQRGLLFRKIKELAGKTVEEGEQPGIFQQAAKKATAFLEHGQTEGRAMWDALGHPFEGDPIIEQGLGRSSYGAYEQPRRTLGLWANVDKNNPRYTDALAGELNQLHNDPITQGLLRAGDPAAAKEWLYNGTGRTLLNDFARTSRGADIGLPDALRNDPVLARQIADREVDERLARVAVKTQGHPDLLSVIRDGDIRGTPWAGYYNQPSGDAIRTLRGMVENEGAGPQTVKDEYIHSLPQSRQAEARATMDKAVNWMFDTILTEPENFFARSPYIRQQYYARMEQLFPNVDQAGRDAVMAKLGDANLGRDTETRFAQMASKPLVANPIPAEAADTLAKQFAVDQSRTYLHNLYQKSQFFDALRFVFPFGDAWKKLLTRWSTITFENPQVVRRVQQGIVGARGAGIFRQDANGNEVFTFPGSGFITDQLFGVPVPLTGQVKNLNLLSEGLPGLGPMVSLPAAYLLPNKPDWDWARKIIFPFGEPDTTGGPGAALINELEPAWAKKFATAFFGSPESDRVYGNAVSDMVMELASTGRYKLNGPNAVEETNRILTDAKDKAKWLYIIRGATQFLSPSAPTPEWQVQDKSGNWLVMQKVIADYYDHISGNPKKGVKALGYDGATRWFFDTYGENLGELIQPESTTTVPNLPKGTVGLDWEREHPDLVSRFPKTWTFYAPQGGARDPNAYTAQFGRNQRLKMTPEQHVANANNRIASYQYYIQKDKYPNPTPEESQYLSDLKAWLGRHYPGYGSQTPNYNEVPNLVNELTATAKDPQLRNTDAGKGLAVYLKARDDAIASARGKGVKGWQTAQATQDERDFLAETGAWVIRHHPDFQSQWDFVWSREIHATSAPTQPAQAPAQQQAPVVQQAAPWQQTGIR